MIHEKDLAERLWLHAHLRYVVAATVAVAGVLGGLLDLAGLSGPALLATAAVIALYNLPVRWAIRRVLARDPRACTPILHASVVLDYLALSVVLWLLGGLASPFVCFFLLHVIVSCVLLAPSGAVLHGALAIVLLALLGLVDAAGWLPPPRPEGLVLAVGRLAWSTVLAVVLAYAFLITIATWLLAGIARVLEMQSKSLEESRQQAKHLASLRRDFLSIALHDLRAPLAAVTSMLDAVATEPLSPMQQQMLDRCRVRIDSMLILMKDLVTLAHLETRDLAREIQPLDLRPLVGELVQDFQDAASAHRHHLEAVCDPDLPLVRSLPLLLREAVANLLSNAVKYTPDGGRITLRATTSGPWVLLSVSDTGVGIAPDDLPRLFVEASRIRSLPQTRVVPGSGLGLAIVKRIAEALGGRVEVESQPGVGSCFTLYLPAVASSP